MSKITRKCPNCGATMPADAKFCRKCRAPLDSGRVENLTDTGADQKNVRKRPASQDALHDLPRPVRPAGEKDSAAGESGSFVPAYAGESKKQARRSQDDGGTPRPTSTARSADDRARQSSGRSDRNLWQIITVLAIIFVIIVVAIVLVIKLNKPSGSQVQPSEQLGNVTVSGTLSPEGEGEGVPPQSEPTATPAPTATPKPTATPEPTATPVPTATPIPTPVPNYTITAVSDTVYVVNGPVNLRRDPSQTLEPITQLQTGTSLMRTGRTNTGWSRVNYQGMEGFVAENYLSSTAPAGGTTTGGTTGTTGGTTAGGTTGSTGTTGGNTGGSTGSTGGSSGGSSYTVTEASGTVKVATTSGANLRTGPGQGYTKVYTVAAGTSLTRTGVSGGWTRVSYNGQTLFVSTSLLEGNYTGSNFSVTPDSGTGTVTGNDVNVRSGPGTGYSRLGSVNKGQTLTITGKSGSWYEVSYGSGKGYISDSYLTKGDTGSSGGTTSSTGTVRTSSGGPVNVRSGPGTGYGVIGSVNSGSTVTITGESSGWYQISYNGTTGYVSSTYVVKN